MRHEVPGAFRVILGTVSALCSVGLVMVFSVTTVKATYEESGGVARYLSRQAAFVAVGVLIAVGLYRLGYRAAARLAPFGLVVSVVALVAVLFARPVNGSSRWFGLPGGLTFQPSEIAKVALVLWIAAVLGGVVQPFPTRLARRVRVRSLLGVVSRRPEVAVIAGLGVVDVLLLLETDLGTTVVLTSVVLVMLWVSGRFGRGALLVVPLVVAIVLMMGTGYHKDRFDFLHPERNGETTNLQLQQSMRSISAGGLLGNGPGASMAKWGALPEADTDAIFAVVAEDYGFVGA
ncbi:MAG: FtsW/RodA/SpoVE family cell cycle protein [Microthrixaceae bacterium]